MHDTNSFARMPALDSPAEQPLEEMLGTFVKECEVAFKGEVYLVRDNGAVFRRARPQGRPRPLDGIWTFGTLNRHSGYSEIAGVVVHRVVATAFHGPGPSAGHVVDHIDTNRLNNRPDNLRWLTRLDNILLNPITRARIEIAYGSLAAFFENPGACSIPKWDWMKIVTKEEAQESRKRLLAWAEKGQAGTGGALGKWLYESAPESSPPTGVNFDAFPMGTAQREGFEVPALASLAVQGTTPRRRGAVAVKSTRPESSDIPSLTPSAFQRRWRTPTAFPQCPTVISEGGVATYLARLLSGAVFARNRYGESTVVEAAIGRDGVLSVVCNNPSGVKDWSHAKVYVDDECFCHESGGTFFSLEGAMKAHCIAIGEPAMRTRDRLTTIVRVIAPVSSAGMGAITEIIEHQQ